jgi:shikimate 5-dehydrogenase
MFEHLSGATRISLIVGDPIAQVRSPAPVSRRMVERGYDGILIPVQIGASEFGESMRAVKRTKNIDGIVATVPHKFAAFQHCDRVSERANLLGAVNVMRRDSDGRWSGEHVDGPGFVAGLRAAGFDPKSRRALLAGAGGAGSAIALELLDVGVRALAIHDTSNERRDLLLGRLRLRYPDRVEIGSHDPAGFDLVVNATPTGMNPADPLPFLVDNLDARTFVADVVTSPEVTPLIAEARRRGCATQVGPAMVAGQVDLLIDVIAGINRNQRVLRTTLRAL